MKNRISHLFKEPTDDEWEHFNPLCRRLMPMIGSVVEDYMKEAGIEEITKVELMSVLLHCGLQGLLYALDSVPVDAEKIKKFVTPGVEVACLAWNESDGGTT